MTDLSFSSLNELAIPRLTGRCRLAFRHFSVRYYHRLPSTQDLVKNAARAVSGQVGFHEEGFCVVAREQTKGRGTRGHQWIAPSGSSLLFSILLRPQTFYEVHGISLMAGLAVIDGVNAFLNERCIENKIEFKIKWPNDVYIKDLKTDKWKKLAGVLAEAITGNGGSTPAPIVLGIGLNLTVKEFPDDINGISLHEAIDGQELAWYWLLEAIVPKLGAGLQHLREKGMDSVIAELNDGMLLGIGKMVTVKSRHGKESLLMGTMLGIDNNGALLVETEDKVEQIWAGEYSIDRWED